MHHIKEKFQLSVSSDFILQSRIHSINREFENAKVYIKREDELSSGVAGCKYRKFASLLPFFLENSFDEILLLGSSQSNNIVGVLQLLNENQIPAKLMLLESNENDLKGNLLWISVLHDMTDTLWVKRENWKGVLKLATDYKEQEKSKGRAVFVLPEGGSVVQSMPGAMTLASDIQKNEVENNIRIDHIFIDSGTGTSAIGLINGFDKEINKSKIHITLIAGTKDEFIEQYDRLVDKVQPKWESNTWLQTNINFYVPLIAPSFGSVNTSVLRELLNIAQDEGILMDPVYSVKHFVTAMDVIEKQKLTGNILFIYNGGSFALSGYQEKINQMLAK